MGVFLPEKPNVFGATRHKKTAFSSYLLFKKPSLPPLAADDLPFSLILSHSEGRKTKHFTFFVKDATHFTPLAREAGEERGSGSGARAVGWDFNDPS